MSHKIFRILLPNLILIFLGACNQQQPDTSAVNTEAAEAKYNELAPAVGDYCGKMFLTADQLPFDVEIHLDRVEDNVHSSASQDPTDTNQQPKLIGNMQFPAIQNEGDAAYADLPDLMSATSGSAAISFSYGDYDSNLQLINLPFTVPSHPQGDYGFVKGTLNGSDFSGVWNSNSGENVGNFDVTKPCPSPSPSSTAESSS